MNTILIATDFSVTANHAATYVSRLSRQFSPKRIILYYAIENINPDKTLLTDSIPPYTEIIGGKKEQAMRELNLLMRVLKPLVSSRTTIQLLVNNEPLLKGANELVNQERIDLISIGISGKGNQNKNIIGSNTLELMKECSAPLLVVPSKVDFKPIRKVMLAWDHKDTKRTLPVFQLSFIIQALLAKLLVVYIDNNSDQSAADIIEESRDLHELLKNLNPEVHAPKDRSITEGLLKFVEDREINLIVIVPKKGSFLQEFFNQSSMRKIALKTEIPLLILRK